MSRTKGYKCFNTKCGSCIGKTLCGEPADTALGCDSRVVGKKMTNADRIRAMTDEELERFLDRVYCKGWNNGANDNSDQDPNYHEWLQQPAEEDDHESV